MITYQIYDIMYNITFSVMIPCSILQKHTFLAFLAPIIIDITHDNTAKIMEKGYDYMIPRLPDIIGTYHTVSGYHT